MNKHIKITFGLYMTIAFITLVILISISDMVIQGKAGMDIGSFTLYSGSMITIAKTHFMNNENKKEN